MQENEIKLQSRYPDVITTYHKIDENTGYITTNGIYCRTMRSPNDDTKIEAIDFEGGPMISIGDELADKKIKRIYSAYIIELE